MANFTLTYSTTWSSVTLNNSGIILIPYNAILTWVATPQVRAEAALLPRISNPQHLVHVALLCMNVA